MLLDCYSRPRFDRLIGTASVLVALSFARGALAQQTAPTAPEKTPSFEVVAIKLSDPDSHGQSWHGTYDRVTIQNYTLRHMIRVAYDLKSDTQVVGGPDWLDKQGFDIAAKLDDTDVARFHDVRWEERRHAINLMLQAMLAERFHLQVNLGERTSPVYALVVAKSGARLTALPAPKNDQEANSRNHSTSSGNGHLTAKAISMDSFADFLTGQPDTGDRIVMNRTGLTGDFDLTLNWAEDRGGGIPADAADPGLFTALQDQLGLELKPDKGPVPVVTILAVSKPEID